MSSFYSFQQNIQMLLIFLSSDRKYCSSGKPWKHAVDGIDVDGRLGQPVQEELLVDNILACNSKWPYIDIVSNLLFWSHLVNK